MIRATKRLIRRMLAGPTMSAAASMPNSILLAVMRRLNAIQLTVAELHEIIAALESPPGGPFLVFGLGNDSWFWRSVHSSGKTMFLEDHQGWMDGLIAKYPGLDARLVEYETRLSDWATLLNDREGLAMRLPGDVEAENWRVILVDAPAGYADDKPGQMKNDFTAGELARRSAERGTPCDVFVHDCDRDAERAYCDRWLMENQFVRQIGTLRHYRFTPIAASSASEI